MGKIGINLKKPKYLLNKFEYYFSEDQGRYIIEISKKNLNNVIEILNKNSVHYDELGILQKDYLFIDKKTKVSIDELISFNKNWLKNYMTN